MEIPWPGTDVVFVTGVNASAIPAVVGIFVADMSKKKIIMKINFLQSDIDVPPNDYAHDFSKSPMHIFRVVNNQNSVIFRQNQTCTFINSLPNDYKVPSMHYLEIGY